MQAMRIQPGDSVAVALSDLRAGTRIALDDLSVTLQTDVGRGHKFALRPIRAGENVIKYGYPIGHATRDIAVGEWVHVHNVRTNLEEKVTYAYAPRLSRIPPQPPQTFRGFRRADGKVGIRNEIWIVPTVGCVNSVGQNIARMAMERLRGSVEGVYCFPHPYGCSQLGDDLEMTQKALCGLIRHPNAGGVLVLGLGCESNTIDAMRERLGPVDGSRVRYLIAQECEDEVAEALRVIDELMGIAGADARKEVPMGELIVGLKCGGSDGLSGITANPLVGAFSNRLIAQGGSTILTEVPEMFGAETILMDRCENAETFAKVVDLIEGFKAYFTGHGQPVYENPSPGNKDGGITTLEDKSLGCTQKAGTANVVDVLGYGAQVARRGLSLLEAPGNDLVASTALAVSGAHLVLFTTGRGTPFGAPVPTVKIASNTPMARRKAGWIDVDAGELLDGATLEAASERLFEFVRRLASGEVRTRTEENGIRDLAIFKGGVTL